jgi:hypothetical protein
MTVDDEEDGIMGTIVVPADSADPIDDGDLLCILLHRPQAGGKDGETNPSNDQEDDINDSSMAQDNAADKPEKEK